MGERLHKRLMLTKAGGYSRLTHNEKLYPDLIIDSQGRVIKDRKGIASQRKATRQEMREATKLGV